MHDMTLNVTADLDRAARRSDALPEGWDEAHIARAVRRYVRFLGLVAEDPTRPVAPTRDIDFVWHLHMLSPVAYHRDCLALFGEVLDHDGGFGKEADELPVLQAVFEDTAARWEARYGEPYLDPEEAGEGVTKCWHDCQGRCWHACKTAQVEV